jgi:UDP-glucose 6-dehydrogenase
VNPMHTLVPGTDGQLSYGGMCFPKDTSALLREMERANLPCAVLRSTVEEQERMRGSK